MHLQSINARAKVRRLVWFCRSIICRGKFFPSFALSLFAFKRYNKENALLFWFIIGGGSGNFAY